MTVCNMSIEGGARAGMIAPDDTTFAYLEGRKYAPKGADWERALEDWRTLRTDDDAVFDREIVIDAANLRRYVSWGTNPAQTVGIDGTVPDPEDYTDPRSERRRPPGPGYMALTPGTPIRDIPVDAVFIGSCTNGRLEDLRAAAEVVAGRPRARADAGDGRARVDAGQGRRRGRGAGPHLHRRRLRVAGGAGARCAWA